MKLPDSNIATETSGLLASSAFGIGDAGMILEILRTKIYSDPILAICREITCNARDAHREVGTPDRPIEVHFPNAWSTNLIIKDYGPGISPSRMTDIFTKFGSSTKRSDNIQTGGFGLGCKTPFAYSDTFTVNTIVDNVKYTYSAYIDETRVGQMSLLQKQPTSDENGTSIEIPISKGDYTTFTNMIVKVTQHWDIKPLLFGQNPPPWKTYDYVYTGTRWKLPSYGDDNYRRYSYNQNQTSFALIDGIAYKLDIPSLVIPSLVNATNLHKAVLNTGFHIDFNIGDLSLTASRDSIHYDEATQKVIIDRINDLCKEIVDIISDKIKNATSYVEACNAYETVKNTLNDSGLMDNIEGIQWKGNKIRLTIRTNDIGKWAKQTSYTCDPYNENNKVKTSRRDFTIHWRKDNIDLYHHDIKQRSVPGYLIKHLLETTTAKTIQVLWTEDVPSSAEYATAVSRREYSKMPAPVVKYDKDLMKLMGYKSLQAALDSVPKEAKKQRKVRGKIADGNIMGYVVQCHYNDVGIASASFPLNQGGTFIQVDYKHKLYKSCDKHLSPKEICMLAEFVGGSIGGFTEFRMKKLGDEWIHLFTKVEEKMKLELKNVSVQELNDTADATNYLFEYHMMNISRLARKDYRDMFNDDSPLAAYIDESNRVKELRTKYKYLMPILKLLGKTVKEGVSYRYSTNVNVAPNCKLALLYKEVKDRYPLMSQLSTQEPAHCKDIIDYMNLIDENIKQKKTPNLKLTGTG